MAHSTHDTLINRFLDARGLLLERSALAESAEGCDGMSADPQTLHNLYGEIDGYLESLAGDMSLARHAS